MQELIDNYKKKVQKLEEYRKDDFYLDLTVKARLDAQIELYYVIINDMEVYIKNKNE